MLFVTICTDGGSFHSKGAESWSPMQGVIMNLPPEVRNKFACILLFGVMPHSIKDYDSLVSALLRPCAAFLWETSPRGPGLQVWNEYRQEFQTKWVSIKRLVEDSGGGIQKPACCKRGSYVGTTTLILLTLFILLMIFYFFRFVSLVQCHWCARSRRYVLCCCTTTNTK